MSHFFNIHFSMIAVKGGMRMSSADRLREVRKFFHLNQRQLAEKIGVTSHLISQMESGAKPVSAVIARVAEAELGISVSWLLYGSGDMVSEKQTSSKQE